MIYIGKYSDKDKQAYTNYAVKKLKNSTKTPYKEGYTKVYESVLGQLNEMLTPKLKIKSIDELISMEFEELNKRKKYLTCDDTGKKNFQKFSKGLKRCNNLFNKNNLTDEEEKNVSEFGDMVYFQRNYYESIYKGKRDSKDPTSKNNVILQQALGLSVCPYCNRDYINARNDFPGGHSDHFFGQSEFPFFAISLYNLVPTCGICNVIKSNKNFLISPFDKNLKGNPNLDFDIFYDGDHWRIKIIQKKSLMDKDKDPLKLQSAYESNELDVNSILKKEIEYCEPYKKYLSSLLNNPENIGKSKNLSTDFYSEARIFDSAFDEMIYGDFIKVDHELYNKIPISYLKHKTYEKILELRKNRDLY